MTLMLGVKPGGYYSSPAARAATSGSLSQAHTNFEWPLAFFRLKCLQNLPKTFERFLASQELFELMELYAGNLDVGDSDAAAGAEPDQSVLPSLRLVHGWKVFAKKPSQRDELIQGLEEVFGIEPSQVAYLEEVVNERLDELKAMQRDLAESFTPGFIMSEDFKQYFSLTPAGEQNLAIGSKVRE